MENWKINESIEIVDEAIKHHLPIIREAKKGIFDYQILDGSATLKEYSILSVEQGYGGGRIQLRKLGATRTELSIVFPKHLLIPSNSTEEEVKDIEDSMQKTVILIIIITDLLIAELREDGFLISDSNHGASLSATHGNDGNSFVNPERLFELRRTKSDNFDLSKLIKLCDEINFNNTVGNNFATAMLLRSILDHVPPIFGQKTFEQVVSQYGEKSFKEHMSHLDKSLRKIADSYLHIPIRKKETLPNQTQVNFSADLDVLLAEIVRVLK